MQDEEKVGVGELFKKSDFLYLLPGYKHACPFSSALISVHDTNTYFFNLKTSILSYRKASISLQLSRQKIFPPGTSPVT